MNLHLAEQAYSVAIDADRKASTEATQAARLAAFQVVQSIRGASNAKSRRAVRQAYARVGACMAREG
jgi:hypothetical protein